MAVLFSYSARVFEISPAVRAEGRTGEEEGSNDADRVARRNDTVSRGAGGIEPRGKIR